VRILNRAAQSLWKLPGKSATPSPRLQARLRNDLLCVEWDVKLY